VAVALRAVVHRPVPQRNHARHVRSGRRPRSWRGHPANRRAASYLQPAGWELRGQPYAAVGFGADQPWCADCSIVSDDRPTCVELQHKRRPKRQIDHALGGDPQRFGSCCDEIGGSTRAAGVRRTSCRPARSKIAMLSANRGAANPVRSARSRHRPALRDAHGRRGIRLTTLSRCATRHVGPPARSGGRCAPARLRCQ